ncbi:MAG: alpha-amylase family glycosyl hydrolase, partial [Aggregatilineales bacterium]
MRYFVLSMVLLCLCITSAMAQDETAADNDWWQDTVWYEIFIRSFYDSDGDGIGDIQGIIEKLDYLNDGDPTTTDDLGITGIWLMPVMESVSYHGYDTTDYMAVEQDYGTEEDFQQLMDEAHKRGIRVIVDFVVNHTATEHPWFEAAADHDPRYRDYYLWARENPNEPGPWGDVAWHPLEDDYYYGVFWSGMPDLNYNNPDVLSEIQDAARFWLEDMGVDGFRLDAIRYVLEETINDRRILADSPGNRALLTDFNALVAEINPEALTIGEILTSTLIIERYIEEDAVDIAFEFELADDYLAAAGRGRKRDLERKMEDMGEVYPGYAYASFLTNHDEPRVMTELSGNIDDAKIAASLLLLSPGTPFIYYGEEIGMRGTKPDEHIRTPMQWDTTLVTGGFTSAAEAWQPLTEGFENFTVSGQDDDP